MSADVASMRRVCGLVIAVLTLVVGAAPTVAATPTATRTPLAVDALAGGVVAEMNSLRARHGLTRLRFSAPLAAAAQSHSRAMATRGFFTHESADGSAFWRRVLRYYRSDGYRFWAVGENLAWASPTLDAPTAVQMWIESAPHRKILLDRRWREVGVAAVRVGAAPGVYGNAQVVIVTANFGVRG